MSIFCLTLFVSSFLVGAPSLVQSHKVYGSNPQPVANLIVDPRPPVLVANNETDAALVLEFVNQSSNLPAVPTQNVTIYLSSSNPQIGNVSSSIVFPAGQIFDIADFTTTYFAGSTIVSAIANSSMPSIPGSATVTTSASVGAPYGFKIFSNPSNLPAVSGFTSNVIVEAVDSEGNPAEVVQPLNVALSSSNLTVGALPDSLTIPAGQSFASANFSATNSAGSSVLSASANGLVPAQTMISTDIASSPPTMLSVQIAPSQLVANGEAYSNVIAVSLLNSHGLPAVAGNNVSINLNVSGTPLSAGSVVSTEATILNGTYSAYVSFQSTTIPGTTEIFVSAQNLLSAAANLTTVSPPATQIALYAIPTGVLAGGTTYSDLLAVQLQEADGTPSQAIGNVLVELATEEIGLGSVSPVVTIPSGSNFAFVNLTTTSETGAINITAIASGYHSSVATVDSVFLPASVSISQSATNIPNTADSVITVSATSEGVALTGANVSWSVIGGSTLGTFSGASQVTNASGMASATYNPGTVFGAIPLMVSVSKPDYLPNNGSTSVTVYSQLIYAVLTASPSSTAVSNSSLLKVVATSSGQSLANASVQWSASAGSIVNASSTTTNNGTATAVFVAGTNASAVQLQAKVSEAGYFTYLANLTDNVFVPTFSVQTNAPENILGGTNASISIHVESSGVQASNASVNWQIISGPISSIAGTSSTNSSGYSTAVIVAGESAGPAEIAAVVSKNGIPSYTDDIEVSVNLLNMSVAVLEPHPSLIENWKSNFTLLVTYQNQSIDNASITWNAVGGFLSSSASATNSSGYANAVFESGSQPGNMSVRAFISKPGYYNYSETIYFVVVQPNLGGPTGASVNGNKDFLLIDIGNVIPVWVLIVVVGAGAGGFFFYRRKTRAADTSYEEE